jgi:hypothetical protein
MLQDFLRRNGPTENVSAALEFYQKKDPRFVDLDRNYCLAMVGGEVIATPIDFPEGMSMEEYTDLKRLASGRHLWVEDVCSPFSLITLLS